LEHLEYVVEAKRRCRFLWIGITQYDLEDLENAEPTESHRLELSSNPMTYIERVRCISSALSEAGVAKSEFGFTPFPIDSPSKLPQFISSDVHCFTTICEPWNQRKIERLRAAGYMVTVLWERSEKRYSGSEIRRLIAEGNSGWRSMIPRAVEHVIDELKLGSRLQ